MSDAHAKKFAALVEKHSHQIYRHSTTCYNKQVTIAGKHANFIFEDLSNQNNFLDNRITVKHTSIIRHPGLVLAPESTSITTRGVDIPAEGLTKDKNTGMPLKLRHIHDIDI